MCNKKTVRIKFTLKLFNLKDFENYVYGLLENIGGKDLEWVLNKKSRRILGSQKYLKAIFYISGPFGETLPQRWWIHIKTDKSKTKEIVAFSTKKPEVDILLIVTQEKFSNHLRNWIRDWQQLNSKPKILLWDRIFLEKTFFHYNETISKNSA